MNNVTIIKHSDCLLHVSSEGHVEKPERVEAVLKYLQDHALPSWQFKDASLATEQDVLRVHTRKHWDFVNNKIAVGAKVLDLGDTYSCERTLDAALRSAGSVIDAVDEVADGNVRRVFCCVRPPGHHAESNKVMGFCIFNSIAIGARYSMVERGYERVMIIDWDVHHGNGTQEIFYEDPNVFFVSIHQHPLYPGTGMRYETGEGEGKGYTRNFPVNPGTTGAVYIQIFENEITEIIRDFKPRIIFISAGFDAHENDPLGDILLKPNDFGKLTSIVCSLADGLDIPVISVLEGGYNLNATARSVSAHLTAMSR